jgi:DNA end-binding protein Ku
MAPRPYWKGYLKLSLVSCAVALYPASSRSERISFNWLNRETGNRLRQQMVDEETGEPVDREDRVRGYQLSKSDYLQIEDEELEAVEIESSHTIDIETFVPRSEIDPVYLENSYYLAPDDKVAEEAFAVIREAMEAEGKVGIGRVVLGKRERLVALEPRGKGILATLLHYNYEVRSDTAYFEDIPDVEVPDEMLDLAKHIIDRKSGHFDVKGFEDRYENALAELIRAKQAGRPADLPKPQLPSNVVNLMDALRRSIAAEKDDERPSETTAEPKPRKRARDTAAAEPRTSALASPKPPRRTSSGKSQGDGARGSGRKRRVG